MPPFRALVTFAVGALAACSISRPARPTLPAELAAYQAAFETAVDQPFGAAIDRPQLLQRIRGARVLWLGDTHTSSRLHALQSELLQDLEQAGIPYALVLEAIGTEDMPFVQAFLDGQSDLRKLRQAMRGRWSGSWLDDPELDPFFYRLLLQNARRNKSPVLALEPTPRGTLSARDAAMPGVVRSAAAAHPERLIVVVVGQAHLVGGGDVVRATDLPSVVLGGEPPLHLARRSPAAPDKGSFLPAGGMLWFAATCGRPH